MAKQMQQANEQVMSIPMPDSAIKTLHLSTGEDEFGPYTQLYLKMPNDTTVPVRVYWKSLAQATEVHTLVPSIGTTAQPLSGCADGSTRWVVRVAGS